MFSFAVTIGDRGAKRLEVRAVWWNDSAGDRNAFSRYQGMTGKRRQPVYHEREPLMRVRNLGIVVFASVCASAFALDPHRTIRQLHHTAWTAKDGAPSQISALAQTTDGYLWIGSARGLFRFDGAHFELYTPGEGVALPSHNSYALTATPDGGLWISFRPSGLGFLKDGRMTVYTRPEELPRSQVYVLACDGDGRVWAGTHDGLALRQGSRWIEIGADWNFTPSRVRDLFIDRDGSLWVTNASQLLVLRKGATRFEVADSLRDAAWIAQAKDGRILINEYSHGVRTIGGPSLPMGGNGENILIDRSGCLWVTANGEGIRRVRFPERDGEASIEVYRETDGLSSDLSWRLLEDHEGNIWAGGAKGLDRFRHSHFVAVALPPDHLKLTLAAGDGGEVWAASAAAMAIARVRADGGVSMIATDQTASVFRAADGVLWWGGRFGLWRVRGDRVETFPFPKELTNEWPWEIFRDDEGGGLWLGHGDFGLVHFRDGVYTRKLHPSGLPDRVPSATYHDPQGRIWFGYKGNQVCVIERGRTRCFTGADGIDVGRIRVIRGRGPYFWLGGELGLAVYRDGRFDPVLTTGSERFGTVSGIIETADGSLWLNEMRGVVRIRAEEARRVLRDPRHRIAFERLDLLDGLPGAPQMNWTNSTAIEGTDGRLWFATDNGLAWIDPLRMIRNPMPPPVSIVSLASGDRQYAARPKVAFPVGTQNLEIRYAALSLAVPERVAFRYMLEGVDEAWQDVGTRREAFYTKLHPGKYRFRVKAANNDGVWNENGAFIDLDLPPAFYQTTWFKVASLVSIVVLVLLLNTLRIRHIAARIQRLHDERLDERMRIAHELHDTLLQGVVSASMQLHVVDGRLPADSPAKGLVENVVALIHRVAEEGRQAVEGLRPAGSHGSLEEAFARVKQEVAPTHVTAFRVIVTGPARPLHPLTRDEIFRIGREALMNAFRHAGARSIEVDLEYLAARMTLRIRDDGQGIDPNVLQAGREGHWGLAGMRERAERISARLRVSSRAGAGTEVELIVPATAYLRETQ